MKSTKELNEKLLKFAGITFVKRRLAHHLYVSGYYLDGKIIRKTCPDLVHELDLQKKYLWPTLKKLGYTIDLTIYYCEGYSVHLTHPYKKSVVYEHAESLALDFALAVEKLIDSLNKDKGEK